MKKINQHIKIITKISGMKKNEIIQKKLIKKDELSRTLAYWRFLEKKIVFTNGCFDIIHLGHIIYLSRTADLGNILIVGLNSDESVKRLKGNKRPLNNQDARSVTLASLFFVDAVILFDEDTPLELIKTIKPHVLVKGSDYSEKEIAGADVVKTHGGNVVTIDFVDGYSSSEIIEKL